MKVKWLHLKVPRRDLDTLVDILGCNEMPCEVENAGVTDPRYEGPRLVHVAIPAALLEDSDDEMCDCCFGWNDDHREGCHAFTEAATQSSGSLPDAN